MHSLNAGFKQAYVQLWPCDVGPLGGAAPPQVHMQASVSKAVCAAGPACWLTDVSVVVAAAVVRHIIPQTGKQFLAPDDILLGVAIGSGSFGRVYSGEHAALRSLGRLVEGAIHCDCRTIILLVGCSSVSGHTLLLCLLATEQFGCLMHVSAFWPCLRAVNVAVQALGRAVLLLSK